MVGEAVLGFAAASVGKYVGQGDLAGYIYHNLRRISRIERLRVKLRQRHTFTGIIAGGLILISSESEETVSTNSGLKSTLCREAKVTPFVEDDLIRKVSTEVDPKLS